MNFIQNMDLSITHFVINNMSNGILNFLMPLITKLGNGGFIWIFLSLILIINKKYRKIGILTLVAIATNYLIGDIIIKHIVERLRPFLVDTNIHLLIKAPSSYSFPSGHSGSSFAAATILGIYFKKYRPYLYIFATLLAFSRVYLGVHFFTDVLVGAILGTIVALIVNYIYKKYFNKKTIFS